MTCLKGWTHTYKQDYRVDGAAQFNGHFNVHALSKHGCPLTIFVRIWESSFFAPTLTLAAWASPLLGLRIRRIPFNDSVPNQ